jgi:hypothetical protein
MFSDMHARIGLIAKEDSDRAEELGRNSPSYLRIVLKGGVELPLCHLVDGENSHDDETIDVVEVGEGRPGGHRVWMIQTSEIAALEQRYPYREDEAHG